VEGPTGKIVWTDLTVPDAHGLRDFYSAVVGWQPQPVGMGDYDDFNMTVDGQPVAGVCHAAGSNARIHAAVGATWLVYIKVADLDHALAECRSKGGAVAFGPQAMGKDRYAVIKDPAGAAAALYQKG
jgi:predicted enzyme related to lactoylglutathione lyase